MLILCQVDPHTGTNATDDPAFMALRCMGAGHRGVIPLRRWRLPVSLRHHRQVHQVG
jgi:hypothetical protein